MLAQKLIELCTQWDGTVGELPAFSSYGGYPIFYLNNHNDILCPDCANDHAEYDETIIDYDVNWEDDSLYCDHCSGRIESAYGEEEEEEERLENCLK